VEPKVGELNLHYATSRHRTRQCTNRCLARIRPIERSDCRTQTP
jgi:hypothetical protein